MREQLAGLSVNNLVAPLAVYLTRDHRHNRNKWQNDDVDGRATYLGLAVTACGQRTVETYICVCGAGQTMPSPSPSRRFAISPNMRAGSQFVCMLKVYLFCCIIHFLFLYHNTGRAGAAKSIILPIDSCAVSMNSDGAEDILQQATSLPFVLCVVDHLCPSNATYHKPCETCEGRRCFRGYIPHSLSRNSQKLGVLLR